MLGIQLIGIIILLVTSELDCSSSRYLVYRNYNEKFRNLAVTSQFVYIGGNSKIIQLSSSLKYVNETKIESFPENWLLTLYKNDTLVVCNYKERTNYDTKCINYKVQLGLDKQIGNEYRDIKIKEVSARYVTSSMGETNILTIASSTCLEHYTKSQNCYAISSYLFHSDNWIEFKLQSNNDFKFIVEYIKPYKLVDFRVALKKDKFVYFLFNTKEGYSKLGKICTGGDDIRTNSYEDTPIICADNNKNYTLAQDAIFWNDYLFVAFTDDSSSVICRYDFMEIKKKFKESRQERLKCPYQAVDNTHFMNQMLSGNWCYNQEKQQCQGNTSGTIIHNCTEVRDIQNNGFCNTQLFGSVEGSIPITEDKVIYSEGNLVNGAIVKLGVLPFDFHSVIYAGTKTGKIGKIFLNETGSKKLGEFRVVQSSFPVLDIKVLGQDVYVMTKHTVINVADKDPCPNTSDCEECMKSINPACGWDINRISSNCIPNPDNSKWWLPSVGGQCLTIKAEEHLLEDDSSNGNLGKTDITFKLEPVIDGIYGLYCQNNHGGQSVKAVPSNGMFICKNITVPDGPFQLNVTILETSVIASTYIKFYNCSGFTRCNSCVNGRQCFWCLTSCERNTTKCQNPQKYVNETDKCPRITSTKVLIHQKNSNGKDETEDIRVGIAGIEVFGDNKNRLKCIVGTDSVYNVTADANDEHVICGNVKFPKGNSTLYLKYGSSRLDGSLSLEAYHCNDYRRSCGSCKLKKFQGYQCDWCGTCKSSDSGINPECQPNKIKECPVTVLKVNPESGPVFGGTLVDITGKNMGSPNDNISVYINGAQCTNVTVVKPFQIIRCITGNATGSPLNLLIVTVNGEMGSEKNKFIYFGQHILYGFAPNKSIIAGGKKIQIFGHNIAFPGSDYEIHFCNDTDCLPCRLNKANKFKAQNIICRTEKSAGILTLTYLKVIIDKHTILKKNGEFKIVGNPELQENDAASANVFKSGGSKITITGSGFSNVGEVAIEGVEKLCTIESDDSVECETPPYVEPDFNRKKRATGQNVNIHFDGYVSSYTIYYTENPEFDKLTNVVEYEDGKEGAPIIITGRNLREGAHQSDYTVKIGLDGTCLIQHMSNWNITCLPPKSKPRTNHSDERIVFVVVEVGNIQENLGNIRYIKALQILPIVIGVLGTALLVSVVIVVTVVLASKRKRRGAEKKFQMELLVLEDKIRETSREEFADAQMTIRDIKSDLVTSRVPYCDYQSYAFHQLFPNQDMGSHSLLFEPMVTDDNRLKVQKAMDMFDKLMTNKLFMKSLVQTLEHQNKLTMQDKAQFASLLSVCLLGNMKLFYQLISCLLIDMIKTANKKQHKVLFRRFDTITQRLMVNWLELSLYDHLKKNGGMQLFMLYKATQTVIEKAPIDAITVLCKNTLAEERLLKNRVEHEILTLDIDLNGNSDQRIPVIVLDCDTITQVKKKCCTAIYKNQPASEIPSPDELELEWHSGKSGKLTLQDIDSISDRSNGMVRLNTLKHYMVKNGSVMALMYKESTDQDDIYENQHVQGSVPTSPDHVKLLIPETTTDSQEHKWHLSNLPDEEKSNKEHEIGEIFLNRLFHTKLILRDYIEACFEGITDSQSLSIPVRYFLCMIDKQGKEVGVDGDILQSWKSECYATRVWASLIAKPQILFDVNVPSHVEPCMDILKQVFIDSFTQCPQHVTKDASTQKLLFCKDIPEYRKNVNSFFMKVEAVNDQEFWTAMDEISKEQTRKMKFSRQATLHQLYKFIDKYKDEIIEDFQEKDETKDLAFGNKLEEVIDLMEES